MAQLVASHKAMVRQPSWLTILRVVLGVILTWKGINFIRDTAEVELLIQQTGIDAFSQSSGLFATLLSFLTLTCGFFITVGLFTKLSAIIQLPIVILAIIFVTGRHTSNTFELILTIIVLMLLILFLVKGSGPLSADEYFRRGAAIDRKERDGF